MERHHGLNPDLGYWAARFDPSGAFHPLVGTSHAGGKWLNVSTVPALYLEYPLFRVGGYRLALLVPMLAAVATAFAARALARRLRATESWAWAAFWLVGLASPVAVYALDIWEHALGLALMAWAVVFLLDALDRRRPLNGLAVGLLFGTAATLRNEAYAYGAVATAVVCVVLLVRSRRLVAPLLLGVTALVGLAVPLVANHALERATLGVSVRNPSAKVDTATSITVKAGRDTRRDTRRDQVLLTALALVPDASGSSFLVGAGLIALLAYGVWRAASGDARPAALALAGVVVLYAFRFSQGAGFVPGLVPAMPLAAAGLALWLRDRPTRVVVAVALLSLPVVWRYQYIGGGGPQWGGRYTLVSGLLLGVVGVLALPAVARWARVLLVAVALAVTGFGLAWLSIRSHDIARTWAALDRRPEPVLISTVGYFAREGGWFYDCHRVLTSPSDAGTRQAATLLARAGFDRFALVALDSKRYHPPAIAGFTPGSDSTLRLFSGVDLRVTSYVRSG